VHRARPTNHRAKLGERWFFESEPHRVCDPRPDEEMAGRDPIFRDCWRCKDDTLPCVRGNPRGYGNLHARNEVQPSKPTLVPQAGTKP
jgi:hypothetical protein